MNYILCAQLWIFPDVCCCGFCALGAWTGVEVYDVNIQTEDMEDIESQEGKQIRQGQCFHDS